MSPTRSSRVGATFALLAAAEDCATAAVWPPVNVGAGVNAGAAAGAGVMAGAATAEGAGAAGMTLVFGAGGCAGVATWRSVGMATCGPKMYSAKPFLMARKTSKG